MFEFLFRRLTRDASGARHLQHRARSVRPQLEALEERVVLTTRTVVAVGLPTDGVATFSCLANALDATGYHPGDIIQIEPGSAPGNVQNGDLTDPGVTNLTIEGDPAVPLSTIPTFTISDPTLIESFESHNLFACQHRLGEQRLP
jgi:hypothetical protein